ncbi:MAG: response regulator transcription factor [Deltaproteobacteria bacterium]|nr:response regulator transcription factor [Deltaproteobacteria bacterium]
MERKKRVLIVDDEEAIRKGLLDVFVFHGYEVDSAVNGREGLEKALTGTFDLILLDVMLPELDGFSVCNEIRKVTRDQPIIMLTAKSTDDDIITGLTLGADDYVAKPFSVRELVLRSEAVLRRFQKPTDAQRTFTINGFTVDTANLSASASDGRTVHLTRREIEILQYLLAHGDRPVSRDELLEEVWGYSRGSSIETRTVDIHIAKLRRKIEDDPKDPKLLLTIRGEGYRLRPENCGS